MADIKKEWRENRLRWSVVELYRPMDYGVQNMTCEEIVSSILEDLLTLHFEGATEGVDWTDFFRFIETRQQKDRVLQALCDERVRALTVDDGGKIRLSKDRFSLQKAMDVAGVWYSGFDIPPDTEVLKLSPEGEAMVEGMGVEGTAEYLAALMMNPKAEDRIH